jgi:dynein heavy chain
MVDLVQRYKQLRDWLSDLIPPSVIWIGGLFQPQSYLTAILQTAARRDNLSLDEMILVTEWTELHAHEVTMSCVDGSYASGLYLQGAAWNGTQLTQSPHHQLFSPLPVVNIKAISHSHALQRFKHAAHYQCPVYYTSQRGKTYIFTAQLPTNVDSATWILGGVAIILADD